MGPRQLFRQVIVLAGLSTCSLANAQTTIEPPIINPGARSLGLGGAFVALADDATAAYANPAGLMQLLRPEISAELRSWSDDREGAASNVSGIGFGSFVMPRQQWSLAIYGQTLTSLEFPYDWLGDGSEFDPLAGLVIANLGVSAAIRLSDAVSLGFGATVFAGSFSELNINLQSPDLFWEDDYKTDSGVTAGVLWNLSENWALGASYRSGADFQFDAGARVNLPDILAAGARWQSAGGHATVAAEVEHLSGIDDRTRLHLGGEWVFLEAKPLIGLRAGVWHDPKARVSTFGAVSRSSLDEAELHTSAGIGFAWKKFQLDLGVDASDRANIVAISGIFTF
jgi:long-subunit fatty acid transport protein